MRLEEIAEKLDKILEEKTPQERRKERTGKFLAGAAGLLFTMLLKGGRD